MVVHAPRSEARVATRAHLNLAVPPGAGAAASAPAHEMGRVGVLNKILKMASVFIKFMMLFVMAKFEVCSVTRRES